MSVVYKTEGGAGGRGEGEETKALHALSRYPKNVEAHPRLCSKRVQTAQECEESHHTHTRTHTDAP